MTEPASTPTAADRTPFRDWPQAGRVAVFVVLGLVLLLVLGALAGVGVVRRPLPQTDGTLALPGLQGKVEVLRDRHGIPQIYADDADDLFYAQGFTQAQDRFFEMDFRRHLTAGRLSELLGKDAVETDMVVRTMGWRRVAAKEYELLAPDSRRYLQSFSAGVNAYISRTTPTRMSLEYSLLSITHGDYEPERWTPVDSLAWLKAMAWDLRSNPIEESTRARLSARFSPEQIAELYPAYPFDRHQPIMRMPGRTSAALPGFSGPRGRIGDGIGDGIGSNSWVVSGRFTKSGLPLLANDPHLGVGQPSAFYQTGLHCRTLSDDCPFDVTGFTFAGFPGVVIGHNRDIAWGFTNLAPDTADLFLEKVDSKTYLRDGKQVPLTERDETIRIAGEDRPRRFTVRSTLHGPLVSDVSKDLSTVGANATVPAGSPPRGNGYAVALDWTALHPAPTADAVFMLGRATDWTEFRAAAARFAVPSQNLVYADRAGNIGYQAPGSIPIRPRGNTGDYPVAGWLKKNDWTGKYIPFDRLPSELNPPEGFIVTANQAVVGPEYQPHLTSDWDRGYRSQRIRQILETITQSGGLTVDDMAKQQLDTKNPMAPTLVPHLLRITFKGSYYSQPQELLRTWDFSQPADSAAAAYYNAIWRNLLRLTFHDQLPEAAWPDGGQRWMGVVTNLLNDPASPWWDDVHTPKVEKRDDILRLAIIDARNELVRRMALKPSGWRWGDIHQLRLESPTLGQSGIGVVERLFNRGPYPASGGGSSIDATSWDASKGYDVTVAPTMRMVIDLGDLDDSRWINLTGVSGHAFDSHYGDQTRLYLDGRTLAWPFGDEPVRRAAAATLHLRPDGSG